MKDQKKKKNRRGFAAMSPEKARAIQSKGGKAISRDKNYMAAIGRKGGKASR